ncbi:sodium-dependent phosphate transport protein 2A [Eurytemora carolleeae]|uniref:sodium-dependent phosphate transport protein 2A n=1 Tax=Eurytemora carolleeae TaxID=1294199 RepID=UPI000C75639D|nr:sodium-dependent phosphate transport protein 2A [Eurytemora carolleeae]|eukprot:XP_023335516.1 sodium-dependent phosphate transport protein 2A-like [Eurytemora affinis]
MTSVLQSLRNSKYIKTLRVGGLGALKLIFLLGFLYFFICSLSFLSDSFRVLGGKNIGGLFTKSELLQNPIVGVMIGVLVTVLVQSSSTSTSIIVGLVSAGAAPVSTAIPMIMGSNIGTSVTNTIVSFSQDGYLRM